MFAIYCSLLPWWRHQMETFSALLAICAGNSPVPGEFPAQRPVTRSFDVFFDLRLNKRLSKQPWGWWFETPAWSLWRHRNALSTSTISPILSGLLRWHWSKYRIDPSAREVTRNGTGEKHVYPINTERHKQNVWYFTDDIWLAYILKNYSDSSQIS